MRRPLLILPILLLNACAFQHDEADLIVHNAQIHTVDAIMSTQQAMAIRDGRILELGPERQILNKYAASEKYDAKGKHIYPGFIDGHCHFLGYGLNQQKVDLTGTRTFDQMLARVKDDAARHPEREWIVGRGWDQNDWPDQQFPDNRKLNELFPERPVLLQRVDGHAALVNNAAIAKTGMDTTRQIVGGQMMMKEGRFTGILVDNAVNVFQKIFDDASVGDKRDALLTAQEDCLNVGLTMVCDAGLDVGTIDLMEEMYSTGELKIRTYAMVADAPENLARFAERGPIIGDRFNVRAVKVYGDGALGSRGAFMKHEYSDQPDHHGLQLHSREHLKEVADWCTKNGFQMATHCIGDSANALLLDVYGEALGGTNDLRWRIEHCQVVEPADLMKFKQFNIIPSIQPTHATSDMYWAEARLGPDRIDNAYNYSELLRQNGLVALGTDFPVEGIDPLATYYSSVYRRDDKGWPEGGFRMNGSLTPEQTLKGMTIWNAIASFTEEQVGSLEQGKFADFVVLSGDLLATKEDGSDQLKVVATFVQGEQLK